MLVQSIAAVKRRVVFHAVAKWRARMDRTGSHYPRLRIRQLCIQAVRFATGFKLPSDEAIMHDNSNRPVIAPVWRQMLPWNFVPGFASQAARTELRNLPTSRLSRLLSPDSDFAAVST